MQDYFVEQADYQRRASAELFQALDQLSEAQRQQDLGLFFKTMHKTVDHILLVTRNWRARLSGDFSTIKSYDTLLYSDWPELKAALLQELQDMRQWLAQAQAQGFESTVSFPASGGQTQQSTVRDGLIHVMTHAVHHRGQLSAACTHLGAPSPEMDFVFYCRRARR